MVRKRDGEGRTAEISRVTKETNIQVKLTLEEFRGGRQGFLLCGQRAALQRICDDEGENLGADYFGDGV